MPTEGTYRTAQHVQSTLRCQRHDASPLFMPAIYEHKGWLIGETPSNISRHADLLATGVLKEYELLSPVMYEEFILEPTQDLVSTFKEQGISDVPLIIGGTTTPLADTLIATGANNLLCDFTSDWPVWLEKCEASGVALRRNTDPSFIQRSGPDDIYQAARTAIEESEGYSGFIMGTAVIPDGTPTENLLAVKRVCLDAPV